MITAEWLSDEIALQLNENIPALTNIDVSYTKNTVVIDWKYSINNKFDIFDAQNIVNKLIKKYKGNTEWNLSDGCTIITLKPNKKRRI